MATYTEILETLAPETGPVPAATIAAKLETKVNLINTTLTRMCAKEPPWLLRDEEGNYSLTEEGVKQLNPPTEESAKTTDYQQFITFGQRIGITPDIVNLTAEHVWRGGDFTDLNWVWKAMTEQGVRSDLAKRWWHNWRSFLHQAVPPELEEELGASKPSGAVESAGEARATEAGKGKRDYILGPDDLPLNVGEGLGDMDYEDAVQLSKIRTAAAARAAMFGGGQSGTGEQVSFIGQVAEAFRTFKDVIGGNGGNKPIVITQGQDGVKVQEVGEGEPILLNTAGGGNNPPSQWIVEPDGTTRRLEPGEPVVIKSTPPAGGGQNLERPKTYYVHDDGRVEEAEVGKPIVIKQQSPQNAMGTFINAQTPDGTPIVIDLESYFKLEDHKAKRERDQETHEIKMDTVKAFKDLVSKGARALDRMGEG